MPPLGDVISANSRNDALLGQTLQQLVYAVNSLSLDIVHRTLTRAISSTSK